MEHRRLGNTGLKVSAISLGGWLTFGGSIEEKTAHAILDLAFDHDVDTIDLADAYAKGAAEESVGRWLKNNPRHRMVLTSKCFWPMSAGANDRGLSRKHIFESVHASLRRLGTDYLDLFFCHREDPDTPLDETARAFEDLIRAGKVLHWGTSCWGAGALVKVHGLTRLRGWTPPVVEQPRYNLIDRSIERRIMPVTRRLGMGLVVWSPLAGGALTGKYDDGVPAGSRAATTSWLEEVLTPDNQKKLRAFSALAAEVGCTPAQLALKWTLDQPNVASVITGATKPEQLAENIGALGVDLDDDVAKRLAELF